jgi:hypothetical protein
MRISASGHLLSLRVPHSSRNMARNPPGPPKTGEICERCSPQPRLWP